MNLQISRKATVNAQIPTTQWRAIDDQIALDTVLLYKLTALRVAWKTRARSERPPAGPEKYTEVLGNDMTKQNVHARGEPFNHGSRAKDL